MGRPLGSKNKNRLTKRIAADTPKPLPQRGAVEEPETYLEKGVESKASNSEPLLGRCKNCNHAAYSWVTKLCYSCQKIEDGFVFDDETKRWVKKGKNNVTR
jgi:hypothetical protein